MPLTEATSEKELVRRLEDLNGPVSPITQLLVKHTQGLEADLSRAEFVSACKKHQKTLLQEFVENSDDLSPDAFRSYCNNDEIHERIVSPNVLTLYTGSWENLGSSPSRSAILQAVEQSNKALSAAKTGQKTTQHFTGSFTDLCDQEINIPISGDRRLDLFLSNPEREQEVFRLSNVEMEAALDFLKQKHSSCLMVNIDHFGAINNNFSPEIADKMLSNIVDHIYTACSEQDPRIFRSAGGELMIFLERELTLERLNALGENILGAVKTVTVPIDADMQKMADAAVISAAVNNEVRYLENLRKPSARGSTQGLGDIFISQVESSPLKEDQTIGSYMSVIKARCHSNAAATVFSIRDKSDQLIFTGFHQQNGTLPNGTLPRDDDQDSR
jgi:GGDEF domain-containing protein